MPRKQDEIDPKRGHSDAVIKRIDAALDKLAKKVAKIIDDPKTDSWVHARLKNTVWLMQNPSPALTGRQPGMPHAEPEVREALSRPTDEQTDR
jgi:hypothetical protein